MKRLILAAVLLAPPALAQDAAPGQRAAEIQLQRMVLQDHNDLGAAVQLQMQVDTLIKEKAALQAQVDAAKPKPAETAAPAKPAEQPAPAAK